MAKLRLLGPVYWVEALTTARRWQVFALRALVVAVMLAALVFVWLTGRPAPGATINQRQVQVSRALYIAVVGTQLILVMLAAPAATAGAVCLDRARGTLDHLLVTDLSSAELVLGKLAARLLPVVGLVAGTVPVLALCALLGGVDPLALGGAAAVTLGVAVGGATLAMTLSVWGSKTHEVLLVTYAAGASWIALGPTWFLLRWAAGAGPGPPHWLLQANPCWLVFAPFNPFIRGATVEPEACLTFLAGCLAISAALGMLAVVRVRSVAARGGGGEGHGSRGSFALGRWGRALPGPSLDGNPVLWREWHRGRPARWARVVWALYAVMTVTIALMVVGFDQSGSVRLKIFGTLLNVGQVTVGLLLLSAGASTALAEERASGSLDVLLATPLATRSIVWGKWWGSFRVALPLMVPPSFVVTLLARPMGRWEAVPLVAGLTLAYGAAITSLGLALATWVSRPGRAAALTVGAFVVVTFGWFFLTVTATRGWSSISGPGLAAASPPIGVLLTTVAVQQPSAGEWRACIGWVLFWSAVYAVSAAGLLAATLATFDRCLGRSAPRMPREQPIEESRFLREVICARSRELAPRPRHGG